MGFGKKSNNEKNIWKDKILFLKEKFFLPENCEKFLFCLVFNFFSPG
jgi:hypothetical protein